MPRIAYKVYGHLLAIRITRIPDHRRKYAHFVCTRCGKSSTTLEAFSHVTCNEYVASASKDACA